MSGEDAERVDDRMGTSGHGRGREQVPRSEKGLGESKLCVKGRRLWRLIPRTWFSFINHVQNERDGDMLTYLQYKPCIF